MKPMQEDEYLVKLVTKSGHPITLISGLETLTELTCHPKFLKMRDNSNEIYISLEDIAAFEIVNNRVLETNEPSPASEAA